MTWNRQTETRTTAFAKRQDARDEPILDPGIPIVDTHHHFYDHPAVSYQFRDYLADVSAGHNVVASVYVETRAMIRTDGPEIMRPIGEVEFANGIAAMSASGGYGDCRVAAGIVGHANLAAGDAIAELLDRAVSSAPDRFRGVRQITAEHTDDAPFGGYLSSWRPPEGLMRSNEFQRGFRHLGRLGLSFDAHIFHHQLPELASIADRHPDTTIVLNHLGIALAMGEDDDGRRQVFDEWRRNMRDLARRQNVYCKVGGLGTAFWGFGFDAREEPVSSLELAAAWKPYVEVAVETFGVDRCMMESNFPADGSSCGWVPLWNALKRIVRAYTAEEKAALFHRTAIEAYRLDSVRV